jgi:hypothetical protein
MRNKRGREENLFPRFDDPDLEDDWLLADLEAAQATPFTSESRESTKSHYAGFSFQFARFVRDPEGRKHIREREWKQVAALLHSLWRMPKRPRGRPTLTNVWTVTCSDQSQKGEAWELIKAERAAAELVARRKAAWRATHNRTRVPKAETDRIIREAIEEVAADRNVPKGKILADNVRNALKTGALYLGLLLL